MDDTCEAVPAEPASGPSEQSDATNSSPEINDHNSAHQLLGLDFTTPSEQAAHQELLFLDAMSARAPSFESREAFNAGDAIVGLKLLGAEDDVPPYYLDATTVLGGAAVESPPCRLCVMRVESLQSSPSVQNIYDDDGTQGTEDTEAERPIDVVTDVFFIADKPGLRAAEVDTAEMRDATVISDDMVPLLYSTTSHAEGVYLAIKRSKATLAALSNRDVGHYQRICLVAVNDHEAQDENNDEEQGSPELYTRFPPHTFSPTYLPISLPEGRPPVTWLLMSQYVPPLEGKAAEEEEVSALGTERNTVRNLDVKSRDGFRSGRTVSTGVPDTVEQVIVDARVVIVDEEGEKEGEGDGGERGEGPVLRCELNFAEEDLLPAPEPWSPISRRSDSPPPSVQILSSVAIIAGSPASIAAEGFEIRSPNLANYLARQVGSGGEELYFCVAHAQVNRGELMSRRTPLFTDIVCVRPGEADVYETSDYNLLSYEGQLEQGWTIFYKTAKLGSPGLTSSRHEALSARLNASAHPLEVADEEMSRMTDDDSSVESHGFPDATQPNEAQEVAQLQAQIELLRKQKVALTMANSDNLRKLALLIAKQRNGKDLRHHDDSYGDHQSDLHKEKEKQLQEVLKNITELKGKIQKQQAGFDEMALSLQVQLDDKEYKATQVANAFKEFRREIAKNAENSRTGRPIPAKLVKQLEAAEEKRDDDLEKVRLKNISLRRTLRKHEKALRAKDQLAEGLHMIDFEQLKVENQTLNEKIEERTEELNKLARKNSVTVQVLTHTKEKLKFVSQHNVTLSEELDALEMKIAANKAQLTQLKRARDEVRQDVQVARQKAGFTSSEELMQDFARRSHTLKALNQQVRELQDRHRILHETQRENEEMIRTLTSSTNDGGDNLGFTTATFRPHHTRRTNSRW